jgi:hypothetical protein
MEYIHVTVFYGEDKRADLSLPWTVPFKIYSDVIFEELGLVKIPGHKILLARIRGCDRRQINFDQSLSECDVLFGDVLELFIWKQAYLMDQSGKKYTLEDGFTAIGRSTPDKLVDVDLSNLDTAKVVSRRQGTIKHDYGQYYLKDENSRNGILLNGRSISDDVYHLLTENDKIQFGGDQGVLFRFHYQPVR